VAKLRNPEPTMPQWKVTLATTKKKNPKKFLAFQRGQIMTLAAASVMIALVIVLNWSRRLPL
jgi:hypothetical protein